MFPKYQLKSFALWLFVVWIGVFIPRFSVWADDRSPPVTQILSDGEFERATRLQRSLTGPGKDDEDAEPLSSRLATFHQSQRLAKILMGDAGDDDEVGAAVEGLVTKTATGVGLIPSEFAESVKGDGWKVETAVFSAEASPLTESLPALQRAFGAGARVAIEPFAAEDSADLFKSSAWVRVVTRSFHERARWEFEWDFSKSNKPPRIQSISVQDVVRTTLTSAGQEMFVDRTWNALGGSAVASQLTSYDADYLAGLPGQQLGGRSLTGLSGISIGDINADGRDDLFIPQPALIPNLLLVRQEDGSLKNVAAEMGVDWVDATTSALFVDLDNDGDQDLVVATSEALHVLANDGDKFAPRTTLAVKNTALDAADYDADGLIDLLVFDAEIQQEMKTIEHPRDLGGSPMSNVLQIYQNAGELQFKDVTSDVGLGKITSSAAAWQDVDKDGDVDLVATQLSGLGGVHKNDSGSFGKVVPLGGVTGSSMAWGDVDQDGSDDLLLANGWPDFVPDALASHADSVTKISEGDALFMADGSDGFAESTALPTGWTNAVQFADLDNSGSLDLIALNGFVTAVTEFGPVRSKSANPEDEPDPASLVHGKDLLGFLSSEAAVMAGGTKGTTMLKIVEMLREGRSLAGGQRNQVFLGTGDRSQPFANVSSISGMNAAGDGRGVAVTDWDHDGDLDVWLSNRNSPTVQFFENQQGSETGGALQLDLVGTTCNRDAIGARVTVELESGLKLSRTIRASQAYRSQSSRRLHFGMGKEETVKSVVVRWPAPGAKETFTGITSGGCYRLTEATPAAESFVPPATALPIEVALLADDSTESICDILLPVRPLFPHLFYLTSGMEETRRKDWTPGKPLLLVLWDPDCEVCVAEIRRLSKLRGLNCLVLAPLGSVKQRGLPASVARKQKFLNPDIDEAKGYHRVGFLEEELLEELLVLHRATFESPYHLKVPCSFLLDRNGRLAAVYRGQVDLETVIEHFKKLKLEGQDLLAETLPLGGSLAGKLPDVRPHILFRDYLLAGKPEAAERLMTAESEHPTVLANQLSMKSLLGEMYLVYKNKERARALFEEYLAVHPNDPVALNNLGVLLIQEGDHEAAEEAWKKASKVDTEYQGALQNYATHLLQGDRYKEGRPIAEKLLKIAPESVDAHNLIAIILLREREYEKAEGHLKIIIALEPRAFGAYANLAKAYAMQGKGAAARKVLEDALEVKGIDEKSKRGLMTLLDRM